MKNSYKNLGFFSQSREKIIIASLLFILIVLHFSTYYFYCSARKNKLAAETHKIEIFLSEYLDNIARTNIIIGKQIADHNNEYDLSFILRTIRLVNKSDFKDNSVLSWSFLNWANKKNIITVNSVKGIIGNNLLTLSNRKYLPDSSIEPWKLSVAEPNFGIISHQWVIPAKIGITNKKGRYMGSLVFGINVRTLTEMIRAKISKEVDFMLIDTDFNFILQSSNRVILRDNCSGITKYDSLKGDGGFLRKNFEANDVTYNYYWKVKKYPYIILTGYNRKEFYGNLLTEIAPTLLQLLFIIALIVVLYKIKLRK